MAKLPTAKDLKDARAMVRAMTRYEGELKSAEEFTKARKVASARDSLGTLSLARLYNIIREA